MKKLVILGAGTAGTTMLNKLSGVLDKREWQITIIDQCETHYYQPGFLSIPFGIYTKKDVIKPKRNFFPPGTIIIMSTVERILPENNQICLTNGTLIPYDYLIIATGSKIHPEEIEGMVGPLWHKKIFDFYTLDGAVALADFFKKWKGGKLVLNIAEMPIKSPKAPLEFIFLADWFFTEKGIRDKVDLHFVTPLTGAFTKPIASKKLGSLLERKQIYVSTNFNIWRVDNENRKIISWDNREIPFDVLITVPTNMGDEVFARSGMGDELNFIPTDKYTLRARNYENIFVIGDATSLPSHKIGSVVHFEANVLFRNLQDIIDDHEPSASYDGRTNCFIDTGYGKSVFIDFNYEKEPGTGKFPLPGVGPFSLLEETKMNHYGKIMYRWMYWYSMLRGKDLPAESQFSLMGQ